MEDEDRDLLASLGASVVECGAFEQNFMDKIEDHLSKITNDDENHTKEDEKQPEREGINETGAVPSGGEGSGSDCVVQNVPQEMSNENTTAVLSFPGGSILKRALEMKNYSSSGNNNSVSIELGSESGARSNSSKALKLRNTGKSTASQLSYLFKPAQETEMERQIRTGEMTPFGTAVPRSEGTEKASFLDFTRYLTSQKAFEQGKKKTLSRPFKSLTPHKVSRRTEDVKSVVKAPRPRELSGKDVVKARRVRDAISLENPCPEPGSVAGYEEDTDYEPPPDSASDDEWTPEVEPRSTSMRKTKQSTKRKLYKEPDTDDSFSDGDAGDIKRPSKRIKKELDDGNYNVYKNRVEEWKANEVRFSGNFHTLPGGFKLPKHIWDSLYDYQKVGVSWLWELHQKNCGGILGDEMGLGKTIQLISFLAGISCSNMLWRFSNFRGLGPTIIVCPATVMHQWVSEFHTWWPPFRCVVLHESGSYTGSRSGLIRSVAENSGILITSYVGLVNSQAEVLKHSWHYVILDEGHKIRNPDAQITLSVKQIPTAHRIILSGSPLQNNLKELWSLFDFVFPGKLGTLPTFMEQFAVPITQGGYANASDIQVAAAFKCATVLRDIINPYLLRRMKSDVKHHVSLPPKSEQVLFCKLTEEQKACYINYLQSKEIDAIVQGRYNLFVGLINLRKICNHPHLFDGSHTVEKKIKKLQASKPEEKSGKAKRYTSDLPSSYKSLNADISDKEEGEASDSDINLNRDESFGDWRKSGKMIVLETLLKLWKKQNHKVLLFSQSRQMLCILENFVRQQGYSYLRLDGTTTIAARQPMIQKFNEDPSIFVFILTTKVGGLGVNLTGANRVIIFDPDWNPSTDLQARERAWRIGQDRQVTIYRLITSGTIEEKIYHRQIFKQFLTNRVLKNPKQQRFFKSSDVVELFSFNESLDKGNETEAIFAGTGSTVRLESHKRKRCISGDLSIQNEGFSESTNHEVVETEPREKSSGRLKGVPHLVKQRAQKHSSATEKVDDETNVDQKQDDYVLKKLFRKSGVQAALKHDKIVESNDSDYLLVEKEAERVAADAVKVLKKSRENCWAAETGRVTWTGSSGSLRTDPPRKKLRIGGKSKPATITKPVEVEPEKAEGSSFFSCPKLENDTETLTSAELIAAIKARKLPLLLSVSDESASASQSGNSVGDENPSTSTPSESLEHVKEEHIEMLREIREFIAFRAQVDGQASTNELITEFGNKLPPQDSPLFKQMLNQLCTFRRVDGHGIWRLKPEFR